MNLVYKILRVSFFTFLDISGILLGIFMIIFSIASIAGWQAGRGANWVLLVLGICAFFIHLGHYLDLKYMRWTFGDDYFIQKK